MIEFDYKGYIKTDKNGDLAGIYYRPNAVVKLVNGEYNLTSNMIIDSGADITILPKSEGEALGFSIEEGEKIEDANGIGGQIPIVHRTINMHIGPENIQTKIAWALIDDIPPILGREDIFDTFNIEFCQKDKKVKFKHIKK